MGAITQQPHVFTEHVTRLERQNRMLKRVGFFLFFLSFLAIGLIGWQLKKLSRPVASQVHAKVISANEFHLVDGNGEVQGLLSAGPGGAMLSLNGPNNKSGLTFLPDGWPSGASSRGGSSLELMSSNEEQQVTLNTDNDASWMIVGKHGVNEIQMSTGGGVLNLTLSDEAGFHAVLGRASLVKPENGATTRTSVASLTLFGKDGHVIWMTPKP